MEVSGKLHASAGLTPGKKTPDTKPPRDSVRAGNRTPIIQPVA